MANNEHRIWGVRATDIGWKYESDGEALDPADVYPVLDPILNKLYGIMKDDESNVRTIQSYHPKAQLGASLAFASMLWGRDYDQWPRPNIDNRTVRCLGAPACNVCSHYDINYAEAPANSWRVESDQDLIYGELRAHILENEGDPLNESLTDAHLIDDVELEATFDKYGRRTLSDRMMRTIVSKFGPLYDVSRQTAAKPVSMFLGILPNEDYESQDRLEHPMLKNISEDKFGFIYRRFG